jgi:hypothetical protein
LTATIDEEIERIFMELGDRPEAVEIAGRGEEVRDLLRIPVAGILRLLEGRDGT